MIVAADDDEVLPVFDDGSDAVRIVELRFERVGVVGAASISAAGKSTHRPVAQNGANAVIVVVTQQHVAFAVDAYASGIIDSGSERVVAIDVAAVGGVTSASECADGAVVVDDTQATLVVLPNHDLVRRVQGHANGREDWGGINNSESAGRASPLLAAARVRRVTHAHSDHKGGSEHDRVDGSAAAVDELVVHGVAAMSGDKTKVGFKKNK